MIINDDKTPYNGTIMVNGYQAAGRLLEDVIFLADVVDGVADLKSIRVDPTCADYFESLNKEKWLQWIREHIADENEHFETIFGNDVWVDTGAQIAMEPIEIEALTIENIFNK